VTAATTLAYYFGGPDDGATISLTATDLAAGFIDSMDAAGNSFRYAIVPLEEPRTLPDGLATHRLIPQETA
jgi:hypothetical protein